jgi:hypothetical protein
MKSKLNFMTFLKSSSYYMIGKGKLSLCLTKYHIMKTYGGSGGVTVSVLNSGTGWMLVVRFTPRPIYPNGKSPWYPLNRRLCGPQSRSEGGGEEKGIPLLYLPGIEPWSPSP